jgi:hypothetical protein
VPKQVRIAMREPGIGMLHDAGLVTEVRHDAGHRSQGHRTMAIAEKDRSGFPTADEQEQSTEIFVVHDGNHPCCAAFALVDGHPFAFFVEVSDIESGALAATNAEPPERFDHTAIPKIVGAQEQFSYVSGLAVIS